MQTLNEYEKHYWNLDKLVIGIDEAGRGPLAGPLVVAGVVFPKDYVSKEIYDSKKLTEKKREQLYEVIINDAQYYDIVIVDVDTIEKLNILEATRMGMSVIGLKADVEIVLTDAVNLHIDKKVIDIVKGDQKSVSIAAASILAKVTRDRIMYDLDKKYPQYNFKNNKGYPTKQHFEALEKYGITEIHRKNYKPVIRAMQGKLF
ncbi:MAG: ribonuclease HII [Bacillota bacterium]|jgi:ribonuclease HII|nr:ribonuclease HII [Bacillota bacterium]NLL26639.1 ribonuclease HII [Erysipelotrichia bacterium]